jgi:excisionase family DNA binding protein
VKPINPKAALPLDKYPPRLRPDQAAQFLNVSDRHVLTLIRSGALPAINVAGPGSPRACFRIERAALAAYVEKRKL